MILKLNPEFSQAKLRMVRRILKRLKLEYKIFCRTSTRSIDHRVFQYISGIFLDRGRVNMSKYAQAVPGSSKQSLQHMISKSHWRDDLILNQIQTDVTKLIGNEINGSIHIDESCFPKQGDDSVGVACQYCGRLGNVDNCQVGVFLGYVNGRNRTLIDERLYLPKEWAEDLFRRREAGVPDEVSFKNKAQLAKEMIAEGITYIADIHRDTCSLRLRASWQKNFGHKNGPSPSNIS
jgi:SRSO17 transposase